MVKAILSGEDLKSYENSSSSEAMVYRAAFVRTGLSGGDFPLDGGCRRIMEEIEDFFVEGKGKRVSFSLLYDRLQGKNYGARRGILPLFLAWKICLLDGMPVIYLGNKELDITVDVLNNINQFPESYELYIEEKEVEKELYLKKLEEIFCKEESIHVSNRFFYIMESMQRWYRSLSQFTRTSGDYPKKVADRVKNVRKLLKQTELNPREFLFEQLLYAMDALCTLYNLATDNGSLFSGGSAIEPTVHCETDDWFQCAISHCRNVTVLHANHRDDGVFRFKLLAVYQPMFR